MVITSIEEYPKGKGRVAVYLNNEFAFVLYKGELKKYNLREGIELSEDIYTAILDEVLNKRAIKRGMNLLQSMDRTESDIRQKLGENGYPSESINVAIDYLKSYKYIDDYRFAQEYYRFKCSSFSRRTIVNKLLAKGISTNIIESAINDYEEENSINSEEQTCSLICKLIQKKCHNNIGEIGYEEKQKLFAYLYNKGFSISDIERAYSSLIRS